MLPLLVVICNLFYLIISAALKLTANRPTNRTRIINNGSMIYPPILPTGFQAPTQNPPKLPALSIEITPLTARGYFDKYLETYGEYGNRRVVAMAKLGLARYYEVQGFPVEASDFANQAYELLSQINAQWELKQVKELLGRLEKLDGAAGQLP